MGYGEQTFVEGVGDEVIWGVTFSIFSSVIIAMALYIWSSRRPGHHPIHPESQENVQSVRDRLRDENRIPPGRTSSRQDVHDSTCPICLTNPTYGIETNCGHVFCGMCMITYWQHGTWHGAIRCPVCRQTVTIMLFLFSENENNTQSAEKTDVISNINIYNRRFSGEPRDLMEHLRDVPMLMRHLMSEFFSQSGLIFMFRLRVVVCFLFAIIYLISPLDLIPEAVFGILGFLDDFFVLMLLTIYLSIIYRGLVAMRAENS